MPNLETRIKNLEHRKKSKQKRGPKQPENSVFILPDEQKRYQAFIRYAKKHPEREWIAILLPAKQQFM